MGLNSEEKQTLCWTLSLRLFPENVSSFPSDRAVSWGSKDGRRCCWRNPNPSLSVEHAGPELVLYLSHPYPTAPQGRRDPRIYLSNFLPAELWGWICSHFESLEGEFVHILKMKSSEVLRYQPRGLMQKAESIWGAGRKYIYGNISLARGCFFPPSLMSGLSNPDRFLQEMGPIYSSAFIFLPAPHSFEVAVKSLSYLAVCGNVHFCRNKGIWEHWNHPPEWDCSWQFVLPSPPGRGAELACSSTPNICSLLVLLSPGKAVSPSYLMLFLPQRETRVMSSYSPSQGSVSRQSFSCYIFYLPSIFCYRLCIKRSCFITVFSL